MLTLRQPTVKEFEQICLFINEFELDNRELKSAEFIAAFNQNELLGFGRLRLHTDSIELCSLGVVTPYRRKGIGKAIVSELIKKAPSSIHLVCIIPNFFQPFGFQQVENYPESIENKRLYCTNQLCVPEKYVVMRLTKQ